MKVLHLVSSLDPKAGGVSQAVRTMIKGLAQLGVQNETACVDAPDATYLGQDNFPVHATGPGKTSWKYSPQLLRWLKKNIEAYDAVILHGLWQYQTLALNRSHKKISGKRPPLFVMPHGMLDPYFQKASGRKLKALRNRVVWSLIEKAIVNNADGLLFTCETERTLAKESFSRYRPRREKVVGLGVESPPTYSPYMKTAFEDKVRVAGKSYFLFISRLHQKKGADILIKAYISLKKKTPGLPLLVIAGPGLDTPYGEQVRTLAQGSKDIVFAGMLTGDAKWGAFYGCDAFILPSHQENFGIAVVEAMACGKVVLISNQVNIHQEISLCGAGLVAPNSSEGVAQLLEQWAALSPASKQRMEKESAAAFLKHFAEETAAQKLFQALNSPD